MPVILLALLALVLAMLGHLSPASGSPLRVRLHSDTVRTLVIGDSIADGVRRACACQGRTRVGASSRMVLGYVRVAAVGGRHVVLSSGASNSPGDLRSVEAQLAHLVNSGARVTLLGVGPRFAHLNGRLAALAARYGVRFQPIGATGADGVHPRSYGALARTVR